MQLTTKKITSLCFLCMLFFAANLQKVHAINVNILSNISPTESAILVQETISATTNALTSASNISLQLKELTLDGIAWSASKKLIDQLTGDVLEWASTGAAGNPMFIQNYEQHYSDIGNKKHAERVYSDDLNYLCEQVEFPVRAALATQHKEVLGGGTSSESEAGENRQCITEKDAEGDYYEDLFKLAVYGEDDSVFAYLEEKEKAYIEVLDAMLYAKQEADHGRGYMSVKVCNDIGRNSQVDTFCEITTPGASVEKAISYQIAEVPTLSLFQGDEFNEIISSLMSGLTNKALTSASGLLGLSSNSKYSNNTYGDGTQSYFNALQTDTSVQDAQLLLANPIKDALLAELEYAEIQAEILVRIAELEVQIAEGNEKASSCFTTKITEELTTEQDNATQNLAISTTTQSILTILDTQYDEATEPGIQSALLNQYLKLDAQGFIRTEIQNLELRLSFFNLNFAEMIDGVQLKIDKKFEECDITNESRPEPLEDTEEEVDEDATASSTDDGTSTSTATSTPTV